LLLLLALLRDERHRCGVHAVAQPGRWRSIVEDVAEMPAAAWARHLVAHHAEAPVDGGLDVRLRDRGPEAGPAGSGVELGGGVEQLEPAARALVDALRVVVPVGAGESRLGALVTQDAVLLGRERLLPLGVALLDLADRGRIAAALVGRGGVGVVRRVHGGEKYSQPQHSGHRLLRSWSVPGPERLATWASGCPVYG